MRRLTAHLLIVGALGCVLAVTSSAVVGAATGKAGASARRTTRRLRLRPHHEHAHRRAAGETQPAALAGGRPSRFGPLPCHKVRKRRRQHR